MPPRGMRTSVIAGVRAAWSGSVWANAEDRQIAAELETQAPGAQELTRMGMEFHARACRWALGQGVRGVIFAASGLPADPEPHLSYDPASPRVLPGRFVFADPDEAVTMINEAQRAAYARVAAVKASAREPAKLLEAAGISGPVSVQLQFCVHWWPADMAAEIIAEYGRLMPAGSILVISARIPEAGHGERLISASGSVAGTLYAHTADDVAGWIRAPGLAVAGTLAVVRTPGAGAGWGLCEAIARVL